MIAIRSVADPARATAIRTQASGPRFSQAIQAIAAAASSAARGLRQTDSPMQRAKPMAQIQLEIRPAPRILLPHKTAVTSVATQRVSGRTGNIVKPQYNVRNNKKAMSVEHRRTGGASQAASSQMIHEKAPAPKSAADQ